MELMFNRSIFILFILLEDPFSKKSDGIINIFDRDVLSGIVKVT